MDLGTDNNDIKKMRLGNEIEFCWRILLEQLWRGGRREIIVTYEEVVYLHEL